MIADAHNIIKGNEEALNAFEMNGKLKVMVVYSTKKLEKQ